MTKPLLRLLALAPVGLGLMFCSSAFALDLTGASTIQPIIEKLKVAAESRLGETLTIKGGGSGAGIKAALAGTSVGMVSRALKDDEKLELEHLTIGFDALAVIVNRDNPVAALTRDQVIALYTGKTANWSELGGPDQPVIRITKEVGRSTLELFEGYTGLVSPARTGVEGKPKISEQSFTIGSNLESLTLVGGLPGAIGYVSLGTAQSMLAAGMPVRIVSLDGVMPSAQTIVARSYPIVRELNLVYRERSYTIDSFKELLLSSEGQAAVESFGFLPAKR